MRLIITISVLLILGVTIYRTFQPRHETVIHFTAQEMERMQSQIEGAKPQFWKLQDGHVLYCGEKVCQVSGYPPAESLADIQKDIKLITHWYKLEPKHLKSWHLAMEKSREKGTPELVIGFVECIATGCTLRIP